mmetsp:Transcript_14534/g.59314  ORF Transcript_14534/g.59314 Transcript_14534/m.59314 type:complete len:305 (+) Transcript_14534:1075-1989(+)
MVRPRALARRRGAARARRRARGRRVRGVAPNLARGVAAVHAAAARGPRRRKKPFREPFGRRRCPSLGPVPEGRRRVHGRGDVSTRGRPGVDVRDQTLGPIAARGERADRRGIGRDAPVAPPRPRRRGASRRATVRQARVHGASPGVRDDELAGGDVRGGGGRDARGVRPAGQRRRGGHRPGPRPGGYRVYIVRGARGRRQGRGRKRLPGRRRFQRRGHRRFRASRGSPDRRQRVPAGGCAVFAAARRVRAADGATRRARPKAPAVPRVRRRFAAKGRRRDSAARVRARRERGAPLRPHDARIWE